MEHNNRPNVNWKGINIPAWCAIIGMIITLGLQWSTFIAWKERVDGRFEALDKERAVNLMMYNKQMDLMTTAMNTNTALSQKTEYRLTVAEESIKNLGVRQDRFADAIGDLRDGINGVKTAVEVLTEQLKQDKRAELLAPTPPDYANR